MLRIVGNPKRSCAGVTHRDLPLADGLGALALAPAGPAADASPAKAKSGICLFLFGGWSHSGAHPPGTAGRADRSSLSPWRGERETPPRIIRCSARR